jgi:NitT/TauT family transport system substrate-binding protein
VPGRHVLVAAFAALALTVTACGPGSSARPSVGSVTCANRGAASVVAGASTAATASPAPSAATALTVGLGFIPSVQFAPFYLAQQKGYYREAGVEVTFQNKIDPDLVTLVGQGAIDVGLADGTSVIPAVSQGIPVVYVASVYRAFPSIVFARQSSGIKTAADLKGRKIGIPGRYGSSWIMLQALLQSAKLSTSDVQIVEYPDFGQAAAVKQGAVDAATGFINNEPVQLQLCGEPTVVLRVDDAVPLPGPGLITGPKALDAKRAGVTAFVAATIKAMREVAANPAAGLAASIAAVPELAQDRTTQEAILAATIDAWKGGAAVSEIGKINRGSWATSIEFMSQLGLVAKKITVDDVVAESLLPKD